MQRIIRNENARLTDAPEWYPVKDKRYTVATMRPNTTPILVTGDPNHNKVQTMPGGGYATIEIELPHNWDALMEEAGYKPLKDFYIE